MKDAGNDIAIIGMACLFPGAEDLRAYWRNIVGRVNCLGDPPGDWGGEYAYDPHSSESDRIYNVRGGYLGGLSRFDPLPFGIMPKAVDGAEPEHFLALRVAAEALKDAGVPERPLNRDRTEVILGRGTFVNRGLVNLHQHGLVIHQVLTLLKQLHPEYTQQDIESLRSRLRSKLPPLDALTAPGVISSIMSGRIANRLDLNGKNHCLDAACASSLIAVEHGIRDLRLGICDAVLAGGVHVSLNPLVMMLFAQLGALAREGNPKPFSRSAAGTLLGEGVGMVLLKRREDAERDGHRIYAILKGAGSASDGKAKSIVAPRVDGEELALRRAYEDSGISPETVELIEAHGTGMTLGDATELEALKRVFGSVANGAARCAVGSVKSMIGHLLPAAGIAGLIKTALAVYHRTLPPSIGCDDPVDDLKPHRSRFYLNTQARPWIHGDCDVPRRAGVSAFGFGGINAHVILEEYPAPPSREQRSPTYQTTWDSELCIVSGADRSELIRQIAQVRRFLQDAEGVELKDVAYTLNAALPKQGCRLSIVCTSLDELARKLAHAENRLRDASCVRLKDRSGIYYFQEPLSPSSQLAFLFPGEGSQYENMLADLCLHFPEVRHCFDVADRAFLEEGRKETLSQVLFPPPDAAATGKSGRVEHPAMWHMEIGVQSVTTANRALFLLFSRLGLRADAMMGHSSGEFGALEASGALALDSDEERITYIHDGKRTVRAVARAAENLPEVVLVAAAAEDMKALDSVIAASGQQVLLAMDNCPYQAILCGPEPEARKAMDRLHARGISCSVLPFRRAYHTDGFAPACGPLREFYENLRFCTPKVPLYSCATAQLFPSSPGEVRELALRQWTNPVRFREAVLCMHDAGARLFLEVGPRGNLTSFVNDILRNRTHVAVAANVRHRSGLMQLQHALGLLAAHGVPMDLRYLYERRDPKQLDWDLPTTSTDSTPQARLSMTLPMIELSEQDLRELRQPQRIARQESHANIEPAAEAASMARQPRTSRTGAPASVPAVVAGGRQRSVGEITQPVPSPRAVQLKAYLETMDAFLEVQQRAFSAAMGRAAPGPKNSVRLPMQGLYACESSVTPAAAVARVSSNSTANPGEQRDACAQPILAIIPQPACGPAEVSPGHFSDSKISGTSLDRKLPFIGIVSVAVPGEEITIDRELSVDEDLFLADHVLGGKVSFYDSTLTALPVMPLTMSIEMLAEAGAALMPGRVVTGIRGIRANRWISLEAGKLAVRMRARKINTNQVHVAIQESASAANVGIPIIEGTVVLADAYPDAPVAGPFALKGARPSRFTAERMYREAMFSGPRFQAIHCVEQWGEDGQIAVLKALPKDKLFRSNGNPRFLADPVVMDAAGQQVAHWSGEHDARGFNLFPYRVDEIRLYRPDLASPQTVKSRLRIQPIRDEIRGTEEVQGFRADMHLVGDDGKTVAQVQGWEVKRFPLPNTFFGMLHESPEVKLGHAWPEPVEHFVRGMRERATPPKRETAMAGEYELRRVTAFPKSLLLSHGKIWLKALAFQVFSRTERRQWDDWHASDSRRVQRLLGRVAAKDAVRGLLRRRHRIEVCPGDVEIDTDDAGRPIVSAGPWAAHLPGIPSISISHAGETAVAVAVGAEQGLDVGIDLERKRVLDITFVRAAFDDRERGVLSRLPPQHRADWTVRLWCAKEAVAKATGIGIGANPTNYIVRALDAETGDVEIEVAGKLAVLKPRLKGRLLFASTMVQDDVIVSLAACPRS